MSCSLSVSSSSSSACRLLTVLVVVDHQRAYIDLFRRRQSQSMTNQPPQPQQIQQQQYQTNQQQQLHHHFLQPAAQPGPSLSPNPPNVALLMAAPGLVASAGQLPALHLYPLNDSFVPKQISLAQGKVRIGRQTNARTVPGERNGYFDSKVLSRMHAEVWEENGKILIKDVKSSNGTFINSERLSPEGAESEPFELKSEDIVEFGIDIVGEDNRTIVHHKVAAKAYCILSPEDMAASQREMQYLRNPSNRLPHPVINGAPPGPQVNGGMPNGVPGPGPSQQGGPQVQQQQQGQTLGGMGAARAPGKSGLTFDHLLSRLQGEIVKSRDTGNELGMIGREMSEIGETLSGNLPQHPPPPPPQSLSGQYQRDLPAPSSSSSAMLSSLQSQLHETRASLATHADKVRTLESLLVEHDALKQEVAGMREAMEESRRIVELWRGERGRPQDKAEMKEIVDARPEAEGEAEADDDMDDSKSVLTIVPGDEEAEHDQIFIPDSEPEREQEQGTITDEEIQHVLEHAQEEPHDRQAQAQLDSSSLQPEEQELHRPKTPEPTGHGLDDDEPQSDMQQEIHLLGNGVPPHPQAQEEDVDVPPLPLGATLPPSPPSPPRGFTLTEVAPVVTAEFMTRTEHAGHLSSLMTQVSDISSQLSAALALSQEFSTQQEIIRELESRLAGWEEWKRGLEERVGGIGARVDVVETWRKEREEERTRDEEWERERDEMSDPDHELPEGEAVPGSDEEGREGEAVPPQALRPRRRRKSRGSRPQGINGSTHTHGSSSPSSSSDLDKTHPAPPAPSGRRHLPRPGTRVRGEPGLSDNPGKERDGSEGDTLVESLPDMDGGEDKSLIDSPMSATFPGGPVDHSHKTHAVRGSLAARAAAGAKDLSGTGAIGNVLLPVAVVVVAGIAAWAVVNRARE
ncbi:hypothetical protein DACRYDRAFT_23804 [Dacryopinax primogenitus]|uniref:FHA domain-containing protein n=1 Tax=Dacryopinax primogenitus (strain DJM 731) TaxID=1858805 RepID=M5FT66_DACPD|nr:uncharacterized protein DACRYDRAFT_23804 [Dacryopinax primogenitus]EJT99188.1 hypothetical protein DACRYDRAFT_23804 [Dacryopinax primogenitus]